MNKKLIRYLLIRWAFAYVVNGGTGFTYMRCKECFGTNESETRNSLNYVHVKHEPDCDLAATLKELKL